jgi:hypothetical protein
MMEGCKEEHAADVIIGSLIVDKLNKFILE